MFDSTAPSCPAQDRRTDYRAIDRLKLPHEDGNRCDFCEEVLGEIQQHFWRRASRSKHDTYNCYVRLLRNLCDVVAREFGLSSPEVLQSVSRISSSDDFRFSDYCRLSESVVTSSPSSPSLTISPIATIWQQAVDPSSLWIRPPHDYASASPVATELHEQINTTLCVPAQASIDKEALQSAGSKRKRHVVARTDSRSTQRNRQEAGSDGSDRDAPVTKGSRCPVRKPSRSSRATEICRTVVDHVARPIAFRKLCTVLDVMRCGTAVPRFSSTATTSELWRCLGSLEALAEAGVYLRRLYLLRLLHRHNETVKNLVLAADTSGTDLHQQDLISEHTQQGSPESRALAAMTKELLTQYQCTSMNFERLRKQVQNKLFAARKWSQLQLRYSTVIVLLVPTGSDMGMNSQDFEHLKIEEIDVVLETLQKSRGPTLEAICRNLEEYVMDICQGKIPAHRMMFELVDWADEENHEIGSEALLALCRPETAAAAATTAASLRRSMHLPLLNMIDTAANAPDAV